jgi:hypothetical protein
MTIWSHGAILANSGFGRLPTPYSHTQELVNLTGLPPNWHPGRYPQNGHFGDVRSGVPQTRSWDFMSLRMESGMSDLGYPRRDPGISCPCVWNPGCPIWGTPAGILGFHVPAYGIRDVRSGAPQLGSSDFMSLRMESGMSDLGHPPGSSQLGHPPGSSQLGHSPGSSISMIYRFTMNIHTNHHKSPKITKNHPKSRFFTPQKHLFRGVPLLAKVAKSGTPR